MGTYIVCGLLFAVFIVLAMVFHFGRGDRMIAGYNDMEPEEQAKYDIKKLKRVLSAMCVCCALCMVLSMAGEYFDIYRLTISGFIAMVLITLFFGAYANASCYSPDGGKHRK